MIAWQNLQPVERTEKIADSLREREMEQMDLKVETG
jgi:hypothetical protein